jgi:hypothetical protein
MSAREAALARVFALRTSTNPISSKAELICRLEDNLLDIGDLYKEVGFTPRLQAMVDDTCDVLLYLKHT